MTSEIYFTSGPGGNDASLQSTTVGGSKPLHRFIKGEPKIIGIVVLILGVSFIIISVAVKIDTTGSLVTTWIFTPGFVLGPQYIFCGILYILTEHNPTKKKVTISLALSIVTILGAFWAIMTRLPYLTHSHYYRYQEFIDDNMTEIEEAASDYEEMAITLERIFLFYSFVGAIIFIVMSILAVAALRSTKSQAILIMTTTPTEMAAE